MFLQRLKDYAEARLTEELKEPHFERKKIRWLISIDGDGRFVGAAATQGKPKAGRAWRSPDPEDGEGAGVQAARSSLTEPREYPNAPKEVRDRAGGSYPLLAADSLAYVLGPGAWTKPKASEREKERRHHAAFKKIIERAAAEEGDAGLKACAHFYAKEDEVGNARKRLEELGAKGEIAALVVEGDGGRPVFQSDAAQKFWRRHSSEVLAQEKAEPGLCLCCGQQKALARTHERVKGLSNLGGMSSGSALASFDKEAFVSHGWDQSLNSPTCRYCADAYVRALGQLLRRDQSPPTRVDVGGAAVIFWTRRGDFDDGDLLTEPDPLKVERLINAAKTGRKDAVQSDKDALQRDFYAAALSGNSSRVVVRHWIETTVGEARRRLARWFMDLAVVAESDQKGDDRVLRRAGETALPPALSKLAEALKRDRNDEVPPWVGLALARGSIEVESLPITLAGLALQRVRAGEDGNFNKPKFTPERMALVRAVLNRNLREGELTMSESLDESCADPAYACGRLLAALAYVQAYSRNPRESRYGTGAPVVDRYFGAASLSPRSVMPVLLRLNRHHMRKASEENPGFAENREREFEVVLGKIGERGQCPDFPALLDLKGQGRFALGFYHQRAEYRRSAAERREANKDKDAALAAGEGR